MKTWIKAFWDQYLLRHKNQLDDALLTLSVFMAGFSCFVLLILFWGWWGGWAILAAPLAAFVFWLAELGIGFACYGIWSLHIPKFFRAVYEQVKSEKES